MNYVAILVVASVMVIWYIRPLYNFMAKRKYRLLDLQQLSLKARILTWLPAIAFYAIILGLIILPARLTDQISNNETTSIIALEIFFIFFLTRYDKWQTKYKVEDGGVRFRRRYIKWDEQYSLQFKKSIFIVLHKPRFILKSKTTKIVVPMLSHNIEHFITRLSFTNKELGFHVRTLYENTRSYYVGNIEVERQLNKLGK